MTAIASEDNDSHFNAAFAAAVDTAAATAVAAAITIAFAAAIAAVLALSAAITVVALPRKRRVTAGKRKLRKKLTSLENYECLG